MCTRDLGGGNNGGKEKTDEESKRRSDPPNANGDRVRDRNGYRQRAAALCARLAVDTNALSDTSKQQSKPVDKLEVLMVSGRTAGEKNYWVLPGGGVENMESTEEAVVRELREEAGIVGKVIFLIGEFIDDQRFHHTTLYFLSVVQTFSEWSENCENGRQRRWMDMKEARQRIKQNQLQMLEQSVLVVEHTLAGHPAGIKCLEDSTLTQLTPPTPIRTTNGRAADVGARQRMSIPILTTLGIGTKKKLSAMQQRAASSTEF